MDIVRTIARSWGWTGIIGVLVTIVINILANTLPLNGMNTGELSDFYPNLFTPAGITFTIWGVIYLLLIWFSCSLIYLLYRKSSDFAFGQRIGKLLTLASIVNIGWIFSWHWGHVLLSMGFMFILLVTLISLYNHLSVTYGMKQDTDDTHMTQFPGWVNLGLKLPVSVYLGWISVATIANMSALLVSWGITNIWPSASFWTIILVVIAFLLGVAALLRNRDAAYALVIAWALFGIFLKRSIVEPRSEAIGLTALVASVLLLAYALYTMIRLLGLRHSHASMMIG
jgi:hypothetical protein